jgi:periplasmic protein TonB
MKTLLSLLLIVMGAHAMAADTQDANFNAIFDRNKGPVYALYARALRVDPRLSGEIVFGIDIAKTGDVTTCTVRSSTLGAPDLERKLCARIKLMKFAPRDSELKATKTMVFFPANAR